MDVWIMDVGQGTCVVIDCPDNDRPIMLDCGMTAGSTREGSTTAQTRARTDRTMHWISDRLAQWGAPTVVISHPDVDHYRLVPRAIPNAATNGVWLGGRRSQYGETFPAWARRVEATGKSVSDLPVRFSDTHDPDLHCGRETISDILIANGSAHATTNGDSVVVAITYEGVTVVSAGDAQGPNEAQALATRRGLPHLTPVDDEDRPRAIVMGSHHGAPTADSNSEAWVQGWVPYAVIFSQRPSTYGHPACEIVARYDGHMQAAVGTHRVPCDRRSSHSTTARMFATSSHGHMLVRIRPGRLEIFCEEIGEGCSGSLPGSPIA